MLFNCLNCAKSISTKMTCCPYCQKKTARISVAIESAQQNENRNFLSRFGGSIVNVVLNPSR